MNYILLIYEDADAFTARTDPARAATHFAGWQAYAQALREAGVMTGGAALQVPGAATTVRLRDGERLVQDGPFAETKEQLGGFFVIDVPDLDAALAWAARAPAASYGAMEVRPEMSMSH